MKAAATLRGAPKRASTVARTLGRKEISRGTRNAESVSIRGTSDGKVTVNVENIPPPARHGAAFHDDAERDIEHHPAEEQGVDAAQNVPSPRIPVAPP